MYNIEFEQRQAMVYIVSHAFTKTDICDERVTWTVLTFIFSHTYLSMNVDTFTLCTKKKNQNQCFDVRLSTMH